VGEPHGPLEDLLARGAPAPWGIEPATATLLQAGPSSLRFAVSPPAQAELRFTPGLDPVARAAGASVRLSVRVQTATSPEREIWSGTPGEPAEEVRLALPSELSLVSLHVAGERFAWGTWRAPRIVAPAGPPAPTAAPDAALRAALRDVNVVFIVLDAAGAAHFGCYGYARDTTPAIDRLAREGVLFERAFTPAVFTLSAMASVWTSQYHDQHHEGAAYDAGLPRDRRTLGELLSAQGIHTSSMVANGIAGRAFGLERGFEEYHQVPAPFTADGLAALMPAFLEQNKNRRFFAYLHFREPHFPYDPGPPWDTRFGPDEPLGRAERTQMRWIDAVNARQVTATPEQRAHLLRLYDANLARADAAVGSVRQALEAAGLWERTAVIVAADHGEALGEHGFIGHNEQLYDESVHIPLVLRLPRGPAGLRLGALVDLLDIAPTVADIFGLGGDGGSAPAFQGESLLGLLAGGRRRDFVVSRSAGEQPKYAWRDARHKLIFGTRYGQQELYDLTADPGEQSESSAAQPLLAAHLRQQLLARIEALKRAGATSVEATALTPEQRENLKALGYIR